jgi:tRNA(Arg) A34 adenosine deaminase TadA
MQAEFMAEAIRLATDSVATGRGGPFGAVVVCDGQIIGRGANAVTTENDPTAHAEVMAIREACRRRRVFHLPGAALYTSCEPCPMCLAAAYWARINTIYYGNSREDAAEIGFDDAFLYNEMTVPLADRRIPIIQFMPEQAEESFIAWTRKEDRIPY